MNEVYNVIQPGTDIAESHIVVTEVAGKHAVIVHLIQNGANSVESFSFFIREFYAVADFHLFYPLSLVRQGKLRKIWDILPEVQSNHV